MNLCLPAHQHHLLWLDITTVFATISTSFSLVFFLHICLSWDFLFFPLIAPEQPIIKRFSFDISEKFSENMTISSSQEIILQVSTGWIIVVLKMRKVKTYVQFSSLLTATVEENKGKNKMKKSFKFSINYVPRIHSWKWNYSPLMPGQYWIGPIWQNFMRLSSRCQTSNIILPHNAFIIFLLRQRVLFIA